MKKITTKKAALVGAGAALAYGFIKGKGIFNVPRFYNQHKAIKNYVETNHPNGNFGDVLKTKNGWACIINSNDKQILLNLEKTDDGNYIFSETEM